MNILFISVENLTGQQLNVLSYMLVQETRMIIYKVSYCQIPTSVPDIAFLWHSSAGSA